jgi:ectoine hydroxylase-related dioxygenase (phytanoyl-CoA dioxygenase family)
MNLIQNKDYVIDGQNPNNFNPKIYTETFNKYGVLVFKKFFSSDPIYLSYKKDLINLCVKIGAKYNMKINKSDSINKIITDLSKDHRADVGLLYDLGTRPIKLLSGTQIKTHPAIINIVNELMPNSLLGFPYQGETLHIFPPGEENYKYNLPKHQDYPYIMQSPHQLTAYINMGERQEKGNGGIRIWLGSHQKGISQSIPSENNLRVTANKQYYLDNFVKEDISFEEGDFALFHSLLQHEGIQNHSVCTRIVQLIRYSNLNDKISIKNGWKSTELNSSNRGAKFSESHTDLS